MTALASNPLRDTLTAFWAMLEADTSFCTVFLVGNRVKNLAYVANEEIVDCAPADYPRVRVVPRMSDPNLTQTSSSTLPTIVLDVEVLTGTQGLWTYLDCYWAILVACSRWKTYIQDVVKISSNAIVSNCKPAKTEEKFDLLKGTNQWQSVWSFEVLFAIKNSVLENL